MKLLSVIVPIYNVEKYIERCLYSLENQEIEEDDFEIICINDGSPDRSRELIIRIMDVYKNVILIDQENLGVSIARNNGVEKASGKYILFIDPDDYVEIHSFKRILDCAERFRSQVLFLGFTVLDSDDHVKEKVFNTENKMKVIAGHEAYFLARGNGHTDPDRLWAVLLDRQFIVNNNFLFLQNVPYLEDGELIARILCFAERCVFEGSSFYFRTTRSGSATNSDLFYSKRATEGFLTAAKNLKQFSDNSALTPKQKSFINQPIVKFVLLAVTSSVNYSISNRLKETIAALKINSFGKLEKTGCTTKYKRYVRLYNVSPVLFAVVMFLYSRMSIKILAVKMKKAICKK
jgi:glycosyltransferase involved in cell wall biosynthesis